MKAGQNLSGHTGSRHSTAGPLWHEEEELRVEKTGATIQPAGMEQLVRELNERGNQMGAFLQRALTQEEFQTRQERQFKVTAYDILN